MVEQRIRISEELSHELVEEARLCEQLPSLEASISSAKEASELETVKAEMSAVRARVEELREDMTNAAHSRHLIEAITEGTDPRRIETLQHELNALANSITAKEEENEARMALITELNENAEQIADASHPAHLNTLKPDKQIQLLAEHESLLVTINSKLDELRAESTDPARAEEESRALKSRINEVFEQIRSQRALAEEVLEKELKRREEMKQQFATVNSQLIAKIEEASLAIKEASVAPKKYETLEQELLKLIQKADTLTALTIEDPSAAELNSIESLQFNSGEANLAAENLGNQWRLWLEFIALRDAINVELEKIQDSLAATESKRMDPVEAQKLLTQLEVC